MAQFRNQSRKVLLVDDDPDWRDAVKIRLGKHFQVVEAEDGQVAKSILSASRYDLILSDVQMPRCSGLELYRWVREHAPTPMVFMTAYINPDSFDVNMKNIEILMKPFGDQELSRVLTKMLRLTAHWESAAQDLDSQFCKISVENLITENGVKLGVYVRLSSEKYVMIVHPGGELSPERVQTFKRRGVRHFFVRKDELSRVLRFTFETAPAGSNRISDERRSAFLRDSRSLLMKTVYTKGLDREAYERAAEFVINGLEIVAEHDGTLEILERLRTFNEAVYQHSLGVSVISVMIGKTLGWISLSTLSRLAIGGMFHDVGKLEIAPEILGKPRSQMTKEERRLYQTHTTLGREILERLKVVPTDIVEIAHQHHENRSGSGYPQQLAWHYIHPLARVVAVADVFCEQCMRDSGKTDSCTALEALKRISAGSMHLDRDAFDALSQLVSNQS